MNHQHFAKHSMQDVQDDGFMNVEDTGRLTCPQGLCVSATVAIQLNVDYQ